MKTPAREIYDAMILNKQSRELCNAVEEFRVPGLSGLRIQHETARRTLVSYADSMAAEARDRMFALLRKHPEGHAAVLSLLRQVLWWLEEDRHSASLTATQKRDLDAVEAYARDIARFILRDRLWLTPNDAGFLKACGIAAE